jgi:hypothetical protein
MKVRGVYEHQIRTPISSEEVPLNLRQIALVGLAALALGGTAVAQTAPIGQATPGTPAPAATPSAAPGASANPTPSSGRRGRKPSSATPEPAASETPEPPQFSTMDGVWEVQLQPLTGNGRAIYSHLYVTQKGDALTGTWVRNNNEKVPFTGTFDGRLIKLTATDAKNGVATLSGYAENFSDMVGLMTTADPKDKGTPFTAAHRKKERVGGY